MALLEPRGVPADELPAARVVKDRDRHPLPHHDEIEAAIAIHVLPHRVGHHTDPCQFGCECRGYVGEVAVPVVLEQHALGIAAVAPRDHAPTDEQVDVAIPVVVGGHDA